MKRYDLYKDSGVEWVNELPFHWKEVKPWTILKPIKRDVQEEDEIITCFRDGIVTLRKNRREDGFTNSLKEIGYQRIVKGDLVVHEMDGFAGSIGVSDSDGKSTPVYTVIPETQSQSNRYWMYLLREMSRSGFIESLSKSIRERTTEFRWKTWKDQKFPTPPLHEQEQIVEYLDKKTALIDSLIEKTVRKIELLREKRTSLISEVVTKGLNPDVEMKDSGVDWIGEIPSHWEIKRIKHLRSKEKYSLVDGPFGSNLKSIHYVENGDVYVIESGFITSGKFRFIREFKTITSEHFETIRRSECREGDIIISKIGEYYGMCGILPKLDKRTVISGNSISLTINSEMNNQFVHQIVLQHRTNGTFKKEVQQTGQPFISLGVIDNLIIPTPPLSEQQQIVSFLDEQTQKIDRTESIEEKRIELLKEYRQSLISEVVTGKVKVTSDE